MPYNADSDAILPYMLLYDIGSDVMMCDSCNITPIILQSCPSQPSTFKRNPRMTRCAGNLLPFCPFCCHKVVPAAVLPFLLSHETDSAANLIVPSGTVSTAIPLLTVLYEADSTAIPLPSLQK